MRVNAPTAPDAQRMREVPGCKGIYSITADGRVWSAPREWTAGKGSAQGHAGRWLAPVVDTTGYERVRLTVEGVRSFPSVHRLVALAWIENPGGKLQVNHIDGDKLNNSVENLEWCTSAENIRHAHAIGLHGPHPLRKLTIAGVASLRERHAKGETITALARAFLIDRKTVYGVIEGRTYRA